jgi:hypothetical protein
VRRWVESSPVAIQKLKAADLTKLVDG